MCNQDAPREKGVNERITLQISYSKVVLPAFVIIPSCWVGVVIGTAAKQSQWDGRPAEDGIASSIHASQRQGCPHDDI